jgi:hypothetical protein
VDPESYPDAVLDPVETWTEVKSLVSESGGSVRLLDEGRAVELSFERA